MCTQNHRIHTVRLEDTEDLVTGHEADLGDTVRITEGNTDLGGRKTLARELGNVLDDILGRGLQPGGGSAAVGESRGRDALAGSVHATHGDSVGRPSALRQRARQHRRELTSF